MTTIRLNGAETPLSAETLGALLAERGIRPDMPGVAVALNSAVVPRRAWETTGLSPGDDVEIVQPLSGG